MLAWLADREVLLVLDNCEHLVDGVVVLAERLLAACPQVTVLATSRARLLVPYEQVFSVPGLTVHRDGGDAVELFLERAAAADDPAGIVDRHRVARICRSLDGVALAIELAAARLPVLGLDGLEAGLDDRLRLLAGGRRLDDRVGTPAYPISAIPFGDIIAKAEAGVYQAKPARVFAFEEIADAHRVMEAGEAAGKLVVAGA